MQQQQQQNNNNNNGGGFGQPQQRGFGNFSQNSNNVQQQNNIGNQFGQPQQRGFGNFSQNNNNMQQQQQPAQTSDTIENILEEEEKEAYEKDSFELGKVPLYPPPREYCD